MNFSVESTTSVVQDIRDTVDRLVDTFGNDQVGLSKALSLIQQIPASVERWTDRQQSTLQRKIEKESFIETQVSAFMSLPVAYYYVPSTTQYIRYIPANAPTSTESIPDTRTVSRFTAVTADDITFHALKSLPSWLGVKTKGKIVNYIMKRVRAQTIFQIHVNSDSLAAFHATFDPLILMTTADTPGPQVSQSSPESEVIEAARLVSLRRIHAKLLLTVLGDVIRSGHSLLKQKAVTPFYVPGVDYLFPMLDAHATLCFGIRLSDCANMAGVGVCMGLGPLGSDPGQRGNTVLEILCVSVYYSALHHSAVEYAANMTDMHPDQSMVLSNLLKHT